MGTISDKLTYLSGTKDAIKQAIIAKGVEVTDTDTFRSYANKIEAIQSGGGTVNIPDGTKFGYSTFTTVPDSIIPYLEAQTNMSSMFYGCYFLQTVPLFDTSLVSNMSSMFTGCSSLSTVPLFNTSSVTNMNSMFSSCEITTVPQFDTSRVTSMNSMFNRCFSLTSIPLLNVSSVTTMNSMFYYCEKLTSIPLLNVSSATNMNSMFCYCGKLKTVPLLNVSSATNMRSIFDFCNSLTNLGGFTGLKVVLDLSSSSKLTVDSVMNVINNAADMTPWTSTLTLHKNVFNKLTEEQIATASAKGWNIASR